MRTCVEQMNRDVHIIEAHQSLKTMYTFTMKIANDIAIDPDDLLQYIC